MVTEIWAKVSPRERLAVVGAVLIVVSWLIGLVLSGGYFGAIGPGGLGLLGAIAVLAIVYLRYAPNTNITWPAPYATILFGVSAVVGLVALLELLQTFQWLGILASLSITYFLALVVFFVGAALMVWGSYQEWQIGRGTPA